MVDFLKIESEDYILNFYRSKLYDRKKEIYLLTIDSGDFVFVNLSSFQQLKRGKIIDEKTYNVFLENGIILNEDNFDLIVNKFKNRYSFLDFGTSLHIVIPTHRCNLACSYCFASAKEIDDFEEGNDLNEETAKKIVDFIMKSPSFGITIEFQGGEAMARFDILQVMVLHAKKLNKTLKKDLIFSVVTNMTLMTDEKAEWLIDNKVSICTSLDGPKHVHDKNRFIKVKNGEEVGTFEKVIYWIKRINELYKTKNINSNVSILPTISRYSLSFYKEIIDLYISLGVKIIDIRSLTFVGRVLDSDEEKKILVPFNEFNIFYKNCLEYLNELGGKGVFLRERMKDLYETKILLKKPGFHTDFENPCGAATGQLTYHSDGNIYTCNEGLGREEFKLGNVFKDTWTDVFKRDETSKGILNSMLESNVKCDRCIFKPYCGTCMVENYYHFGKFNFYPTKTQKHHLTVTQSRRIFDKILKNMDI